MAIEIAPRGPETDESFDMRALWRLAGWGAVAGFALIVVAVVSVSDIGSRRLATSSAPAELPVRPVTTIAVPPLQEGPETKRLAAQLHALAADRDRLAARVTSLEQQFDDLTGSIKRLADIPTETEPPPAPKAPAPIPSSAIPPARKPALAMPTAEGPKPQPDRPQPQQEETNAPAEKPTPDDATAAQDLVPLPPERLAAAIEPPPQAEKFAIALAGASSIEVARLQWAAVKANFGSMLATLKPRAMSERRGGATHYRLVAGPLPTYDAAARLCARIVAAHAICQPVKYGGEPL